jgi:hypothetical protein
MKSLSLEAIYFKIKKIILLTESYTECKGLSFIIKACRLFPINYLKDRDPKIVLHRHWIDEFGNSLKIIKNKKIKITYNDLSIDKNKLYCTDLYYGLSIDNIIKISKLAFICAGFDEDTLEPIYYITLLGIDNYFRTYFYDDDWQQISTLHIGMNNLKLIAKKSDIKYFLEFNNLKNMPYPCSRSSQWLTILPASAALTESVGKEFPELAKIFKSQKESIINE